jgi:hypothetical protein
MKFVKYIFMLSISILLSCYVSITAFAGTYTVTQYVSGSFGTPNVTVTNSAGTKHTGGAYWLSSTVINVKSITQSIRLNSVSTGSSLNMNVFYSTDGVNFYIGTTVYCPLNTEVSFTINFGTSLKTIKALFYLPNTATWPGYSYSVWTPNFTRLLTDNIAPGITLTEQSYYSRTGVTVSAYITDSESGVSVRKWAQGYQSASYFNSYGTSFSSSFSVTSNGYYTVYARDAAGNASVGYIYVTRMDTTPPDISLSASEEYAPSNTVTASITDSQSGMSVKKWAYGNYTASYFSSGGNTFEGNSFSVNLNGFYTVYAKDTVENESVGYIVVSCVDNSISVTHLVSTSYIMNPNSGIPFYMSDIIITNNSRIKVKVSVQSFNSVPGGSITFTDVPPGYFLNWNSLTSTQTKKYIALGVQVAEPAVSPAGWYAINAVSPVYGAEIVNPVLLGTLNPNGAKGNLRFTAKYGQAWDGNYTAKHQLALIFDTDLY